jgi:two-component system CheB/CheR fusion protein
MRKPAPRKRAPGPAKTGKKKPASQSGPAPRTPRKPQPGTELAKLAAQPKLTRKAASVQTPRPATPDAGANVIGFPVVGIGASAGGLEPLEKLFELMPADSGMAFIVVQHLSPTHESQMAEILSRKTKMPVSQIEDEMPIEPNTIYVIRPNRYLTIEKGKLHLSPPALQKKINVPIDIFFHSLAEEFGERAIAIILSGSGSNGSLGVRSVDAAGGLVLVQDPDTAIQDSMPKSTIATGLADFILNVEEMPSILLQQAQHLRKREPGLAVPALGKTAGPPGDDLSKIVSIVRSRLGCNISNYKKKTLLRRIQRRMDFNRLDKIADYAAMLRSSPDEVQALFKDMLISVTEFFRDADAWEFLRKEVIARIVAEKDNFSSIRVWITGCATGEEAYTVSILMHEELQRARKNCKVQIFATDIDATALEIARAGIYPASSAKQLGAERLRRFFLPLEGGRRYQINKAMREPVVFALQNVISDPPLSKIDLICCRNLMIYLEPEIQKKLIGLFHFALGEGGYLFLGPSENAGPPNESFAPLSKKFRIYRRLSKRVREAPFPIDYTPPIAHAIGSGRPAPRESELSVIAQKALIEQFGPTAVVVNQLLQILYYYGATDKYLQGPSGLPTHDLLALARDGLRNPLRSVVHVALRDNQNASARARVRRDGGYAPVRITAVPIRAAVKSDSLALIVFGDEEVVPYSADDARPGDEPLVRQLEAELRATKVELQSALEQFDTSNEEFKAANEEMMSMNEELQSANEELETSKEELQSLNEELSTVNHQLQAKVEELEAANDDLANLLASTELATLFLDPQLHIKRFTPSATKLFNLIPSDIGRPLASFSKKVNDPTLLEDAEGVLHTLQPSCREVSSSDGRWYNRRVLPYRTEANRINGVVVTFSDVTEFRTMERSAEAERRFARSIVESVSEPIVVLDPSLFIRYANAAFYRAFKLTPKRSEGLHLLEADSANWNSPELHKNLEKIKSGELSSFEIEFRAGEDGHRRVYLLGGRTLHEDGILENGILIRLFDVTDVQLEKENLVALNRKLETTVQQLSLANRELEHITYVLSHDLRTPLRGIRNYVDFITADLDGKVQGKAAEDLKMLAQSAENFVKLFEDLLEYLVAARGPIRNTQIDLNSMVRNIASFFAGDDKKKVVVKGDLPQIRAPQGLIHQIFQNLIENALVHNRSAKPKVEINAESIAASPKIWSFSFKDNGVGIAPGDRERIFRVFQRLDPPQSRAGTGVGLAIVRKIVERLGGQIRVESKPGEGSTFYVDLPEKADVT